MLLAAAGLSVVGGCHVAVEQPAAAGPSESASVTPQPGGVASAGGSAQGPAAGPTLPPAGAGSPDAAPGDAATVSHDAAPGVSPCDPEVAFLCDDFENAAAGDGPRAPWDASNVVLVSTTRAFSGTKSVTVPDGSATLRLPLAPARDVVFARVMVWTDFAQESADSRWGIARVTSADGQSETLDSAPNLVAFHYWSGGEAATDSTTALPSGAWKCLEMSFDRPTLTVRAWLDGAEVSAPLDGPAISSGWESFELRNEIFHGGTGTVYYDDVALGTARLGCPSP
jgi:hypothetical protein